MQVANLCLLATLFVNWPWLALTTDDLHSLWSRSKLHASRHIFSPFGHPWPTQVHKSFVTYFKYWIAARAGALKWLICDLCALTSNVNLWFRFNWPPKASLYTSSYFKTYIYICISVCNWPGLYATLTNSLRVSGELQIFAGNEMKLQGIGDTGKNYWET